MISMSRLRLAAWCFLVLSFLTFSSLPAISRFSLLISVLIHTELYLNVLDFISSIISIGKDEASKGCTFVWKIENLSSCRLEKEECIESPLFTADSLYGTKWSIRLFPKGLKSENSVTFFLKREKDYCGPNFIQVKYQITFFDKNGSVLESKPIWENLFDRERSMFFYVSERGKFILPKDALIIQCKIWKTDEKPNTFDVLLASTIFKVHRRSFIWKIDNFSTFKPDGSKNKFVFIDKLTEDVMNFHLILSEVRSSEKNLAIDILSSDDFIKLISFKASIIDSEGRRMNCGNHQYFEGDLKKGILFPLFSITDMFMNKKSLYFPNDVLSLDCEYIFSAATSSSECAKCRTFSPSTTAETVRHGSKINVGKNMSELTSEPVEDFGNRKERFVRKQEFQLKPDLVGDLKSMYSNSILCDVDLHTSTQSFPAHKAILSARSSVFRRMFSNDMKEKNSGNVDIADLEAETLRQMLTYIYTDSVGDLQMESASKLYTAADKYDIPSLKHRCSSFLECNMKPNTVSDVLVLADMHQDDDLKSAALDYIMEHDKEVFQTAKWKHFMETNLQLAADVMLRNASREKLSEEMISF